MASNKGKSQLSSEAGHAPQESRGGRDLPASNQGYFQVRVGSLVAQRLLPEGNTLYLNRGNGAKEKMPLGRSESSLISLWTNPLPGRDECLSLIGKRIRCFFPKDFSERRVLEGEVVALPDFSSRKRKIGRPYKVQLLVAKEDLNFFRFLTVIDQEGVDLSTLSNKARRHRELEYRIRGRNKAIVAVKLADPSFMDTSVKCLKWVILKRVPSKLLRGSNARVGSPIAAENASLYESKAVARVNGTETDDASPPKKRAKLAKFETRHIGDGNDPVERQIVNWRWLSSRYTSDSFGLGSVSAWDLDLLSLGFIGEVVKVEQGIAPPSLATVTIRRLFLPEHTLSGRLGHHKVDDVFFDDDNRSEDEVLLEAPIEEVVVISRTMLEGTPETSCLPERITSCSYYSLSSDEVCQSTQTGSAASAKSCHRCKIRLVGTDFDICNQGNCPISTPGESRGALWCKRCSLSLTAQNSNLACCNRKCDCILCARLLMSRDHDDFENDAHSVRSSNGSGDVQFGVSAKRIEKMRSHHFGIPPNVFESVLYHTPSVAPSTRLKSGPLRRTPSRKPRAKYAQKNGNSRSREAAGRDDSTGAVGKATEKDVKEDYSVFIPTCARLSPYDPSPKDKKCRAPSSSDDSARSRRDTILEKAAPDGASRANRANHRRMRKEIGFEGALDTLEQRAAAQVRFGRSGIHAWGVFAKEDIGAEEFIIEYRGELIGNAMAEKREVLYEEAKIGSDYMFRIDSHLVCDATKQGNIARFINASCEPNCYTKIIALEGVKRIVIYSKRDIRAGEELCYDYKFPLEYNESKRIPCYCGVKECRGFMNWDKKYVALTTPSNDRNASTVLTSTPVDSQSRGWTADK